MKQKRKNREMLSSVLFLENPMNFILKFIYNFIPVIFYSLKVCNKEYESPELSKFEELLGRNNWSMKLIEPNDTALQQIKTYEISKGAKIAHLIYEPSKGVTLYADRKTFYEFKQIIKALNNKSNDKSAWIDRFVFLISLPGTLHFVYYLIIDNGSDDLDNLLGTQFNQLRSELKELMDGNFLLVVFDLLSSLVFMINVFVFVLKKLFFFKQKKIEGVQTKIVASDWAYAIVGTIAPFLVCFTIHVCSQSIYRAGRGSENLEKLQQREFVLFWYVIITLIVGYVFAVKFWLKHPLYKNKNFLLVIFTTINLIGLFLFNLGIYLFFGGPFP